jgi:hypothetical protein
MLEVELCFALLLFGLYAAFTALFIVCDTYLIPAVEVFINAYNIPEEVCTNAQIKVAFCVYPL